MSVGITRDEYEAEHAAKDARIAELEALVLEAQSMLTDRWHNSFPPGTDEWLKRAESLLDHAEKRP